ncbi:hypothetical protein AVEN_158984-1 [Araneus ventricosus]|uniref:Uncharacterized protein n=1 Tax=Araneus ventricosus TaxID=182803 RepID=A0A4Y2B9I6_ARAVE|nr:hypothetical protein AVEN_158984-1 [Araneus ventricosus]
MTSIVLKQIHTFQVQTDKLKDLFKDGMRQAKVDFGSRGYQLQNSLMQYRKTPHSTTHQSPAMMFLGRDIRTRLNLLRPNETPLEKATDSPVRQFDVGDKVYATFQIQKENGCSGQFYEKKEDLIIK